MSCHLPTDGFGTVAWWGFTPAIDLIPLLPPSHNTAKEIHILLVGVSDLRHVIRTLGTHLPTYKYNDVTFHFYIAENCVEVLTREIMFSILLTEPLAVIGLQERVELYLELLGNLHIRSQTFEYLKAVSNKLINLITDLDEMHIEFPFIDITKLKFKERDQIESVLKFWRSDDVKFFEASSLWDKRLRGYLSNRYDSKEGVFDWDFNMKMLEQTKLINGHEYCVWRSEGLAFNIRSDALYNTPNRSLASGVIIRRHGEEVKIRGYWGDIIVGPFICFGIETNKKELKEKSSLPHARSSEDISVDNLTRYLHQMTSHTIYKESIEPMKLEKVYEVSEDYEISSPEAVEGANAKFNKPEDGIINLKSVFHFLPLSSPGDLPNRSKYSELFSLAYFSNTSLHSLVPEISEIMSPDGVLVLESSNYLIEFNKEQHSRYREVMTSRAQTALFELDELQTGSGNPDHFIYKRNMPST
ncbi:Dynein assembly factor 3, axonemal [Oopsacas minuta]|uniref:Dynein assembly factor 3, axonemal n=1 Tax=Oopsacas minuta TaxID=111878 RepID=A0AAV7KKR9_9METZ|nr:Dynein assembly factor 3, axonemal [Oopsacas minuta]